MKVTIFHTTDGLPAYIKDKEVAPGDSVSATVVDRDSNETDATVVVSFIVEEKEVA